jgi:DNA-binding GntR family transcriptional regulator
VFEAVKDNNPDMARDAMRRHLQEISEHYWKIREGGD